MNASRGATVNRGVESEVRKLGSG